MGSRFRIGIIGAGARGETFARSLYKGTDRAELFGICDVDPDRLQKFVNYCELDGAATWTDPEQFMREADMDAVMITTPEFTHKEVALNAVANGKHFYLEKAMATNAQECRDIIEGHRQSGITAFLGFNMRATAHYERVKAILDSGILGQIVHISGLEQLSQAHSASFMRRFHRKRARSGGLLNTKCSHDLDLIQWCIGHEHKIARVASFGGVNVFVPQKAPAQYCSECPPGIKNTCPYIARAGFVFPVGGEQPIHKTVDKGIYGGDLCVYNDDKDLIDNQTVIMEWDHGVRGNFNLQLFQHRGRRVLRIFGEEGLLETDTSEPTVTVTLSTSGEVIRHHLAKRPGGHGGSDPLMIARFVDAIESGDASSDGLREGLAATLLAEKADESLAAGQVVSIAAEEYL